MFWAKRSAILALSALLALTTGAASGQNPWCDANAVKPAVEKPELPRKCERDIRFLLPYCASVPLCEAQMTEKAGKLPWNELDPKAQEACRLANLCREQTERLCVRPRDCSGGKADNDACRVFDKRDWERRELLYCAAQPNRNPDAGTKPAYVPFRDPIGFVQTLYRSNCKTVASCQQWIGLRANRWQDQLQQGRDQLRAEQESQISEREIAAKQHAAIAAHAATNATATVLSGGTQTLGTVVAGATQAAATKEAGKNLARAIWSESASNGSENDLPPNLSQATDAVAQSLRNDVSESLRQISESIETAALGARAPATGVTRQIDPEADFEDIYPRAAAIEYAILLVPDPRVPRHRRAYDLSITAVTRGMLAAGFVLDRYSLPWQDYLDDPSGQRKAGNGSTRYVDDGKYGVLLFRDDAWRRDPSSAIRLRALYVVAETGSFGVQRDAFVRAATRLASKTASTSHCGPRHERLSASGPHAVQSKPVDSSTQLAIRARCAADTLFTDQFELGRILIIGPAFSGSMSSIGESLDRVIKEAGGAYRLDAKQQEMLEKLERTLADALTAQRAATKQFSSEPLRWLGVLHAEVGQLLNDAKPLRPGARSTRRLLERWLSGELQCGQSWCKKAPIYAARGQMTSLAASITANTDSALQFEIVSAAATASSNIAAAANYSSAIRYSSLAKRDDEKRKDIRDLLVALHAIAKEPGTERPIVLFSEASVFGAGICAGRTDAGDLCKYAREVHFPANIADIRHGARVREREAESAARAALKLPDRKSLLDLADGAENGSEFPESQQSPITAASAELELENTLRAIKRGGQPKAIVIAATDVRDRIFLMQRLREEFKGAMLVDLEADVLLSHPSVINATRGAVVIASHPLEFWSPSVSGDGLESLESFSTDDQAMMYCLVRGLGGLGTTPCVARSGERHAMNTEPRSNDSRRYVVDYGELAPLARPLAQWLAGLHFWILIVVASVLVVTGSRLRRLAGSDARTYSLAIFMVALIWAAGASVLACIWTDVGASSESFWGSMSVPVQVLFTLMLALTASGWWLWNGKDRYSTLYGSEFCANRQALLRKLRWPDGAQSVLSVLLLAAIAWTAYTGLCMGPRVTIAGAYMDYALCVATLLVTLITWLCLTMASLWLQELRRFAQRAQLLVHRAAGKCQTDDHQLQNWASLAPIVLDPEATASNVPAFVKPNWIPPFFRESPFLACVVDWE